MYKQKVLPFYKGFNLSYLMCPQTGAENAGQRGYREKLRSENPISLKLVTSDLELIADLGFNFVRFPLNYVNFIKNYNDFWQGAEFEFDEEKIQIVDKAVKRAEELGIYVQLSLHRAPGYTVGGEGLDGFRLWFDETANAAFEKIWVALCKRYKSFSKNSLGFNLINEPWSQFAGEVLLPEESHNRVMKSVVEKIRSLGDEREIFIDGMNWGRDIVGGMCGIKGVSQSCRAYDPTALTHYKTEPNQNQTPLWPGITAQESHLYDRNVVWDKQRIFDEFKAWAKMSQETNTGVHCGEGGICRNVPHKTAMAWFRDVNEALEHYNIGFALWELRGIFGIMDSGRTDCRLKDFKGHMLDEEMYKIMKSGI